MSSDHDRLVENGSRQDGVHDLRGFIRTVSSQSARDYIAVREPLSGDWELAAFTTALVGKMRMPVIEYCCVHNTQMSVVHNVCASLARIAKSLGISVAELESKLETAYDNLVAPRIVLDAPVRENSLLGENVDLDILPSIRYTDTETHPYISAAHVVARDPDSGTLNISVHRLMKIDRNTLSIYMTPKGHLHTIFQHNAERGLNTNIAAFIGVHPLLSLGSLAAGSLDLEEYSVIGGLLGYPLPVVRGVFDQTLLIPAYAEIALEGELSFNAKILEGPYGEAFGFVSEVRERPMLTVKALTYRNEPYFQDIVPGQLEHLTMTGICTQVSLSRTLKQRYPCVTDIYLPTPMSVYIAVSDAITGDNCLDIMQNTLLEQRFVKHVVLFDHTVDITNTKQTQNAIAMHVQADRDILIISQQPGNGLDPSERQGLTSKWGINACSFTKYEQPPVKNRLPDHVLDALDVNRIFDNAVSRK